MESMMTMPGAVATSAREHVEPHDQVTPAGPPQAGRPRRRKRPVVLLTSATLITAALLVPLAFLLIEARGAGLSTMKDLIFRPLTFELLWNTVRLTVSVTALSA